jgi:hypothetical protein
MGPCRHYLIFPLIARRGWLTLGLGLLLASCGQVTYSGSANFTTTRAATPAPTQSQSTGGSATAYGCPSRQLPVDGGVFHPDVIVVYTLDQGAAQLVTLTHGQHLEIRLGPANQWSLTITDPSHILASTSSEGWYDLSANACVWRFTATSAGEAHLAFKGLFLCPPKVHCKAALDLAAFDVTAH